MFRCVVVALQRASAERWMCSARQSGPWNKTRARFTGHKNGVQSRLILVISPHYCLLPSPRQMIISHNFIQRKVNRPSVASLSGPRPRSNTDGRWRWLADRCDATQYRTIFIRVAQLIVSKLATCLIAPARRTFPLHCIALHCNPVAVPGPANRFNR